MDIEALTTERLAVSLGDSPLKLASIQNRRTGELLGEESTQSVIVRMPGDVSEPIFLREVASVASKEDRVQFTLTNEDDRFQATIMIQPDEHGLHFQLDVMAPTPLWMVEWRVSGLLLEEVIVPALGGQALASSMPAGTQVTYKYPFWWNAQFVIGSGRGPQGGLWLETREQAPRLKMLRVGKEDEQHFAWTLGFEADAPLDSSTLTAEWRLDAYPETWQTPVDAHRRWLEDAFALTPWTEHTDCPEWMQNINFVLELWGMRRHEARVGHSFDDMIERIEAFSSHHAPEETLVYLPGFAQGGIDSNIPIYDPGEKLGGREGFKRFVDAAHALGYRVMIHTNVLGMTYTHPLFPSFQEHQVVDVFERPQGWGMDMDGDWLAEPYFAYIHPGAQAWGDLMEDVLGQLIDQFDLDAVFLDQTLLAFNVSRGPNFLEGMRQHVERLQQAYPDVLFAGEGLHEQMLPALPVAQIHGIDSIAGVHGMEGARSWRRVHPVSSYLFRKYTRLLPHLLTRHPSHPIFERQEKAYAELGIPPALVCYEKTQAMDGPALEKMLDRTRRITTVSV